MSIIEGKINQPEEKDKTRRTIFIIAGAVAVLLIGLIVFMVMRRQPQPQQQAAQGLPDEKLEDKFQGVLRPGSADFENLRTRIVVQQPISYDVAKSLSGGMEVTMGATVANFTGRTISGLEMKGSVLDLDGKVIKERTVIVIPSEKVPELETSQTVEIPFKVSGFTNEEEKNNIDNGMAKLKVEVTAIKLK